MLVGLLRIGMHVGELVGPNEQTVFIGAAGCVGRCGVLDRFLG